MQKICFKCEFFKSRQGRGRKGECRFNPPIQVPDSVRERGINRWTEVDSFEWCGKFELNRDKFQSDGRKINTRKGKNIITVNKEVIKAIEQEQLTAKVDLSRAY